MIAVGSPLPYLLPKTMIGTLGSPSSGSFPQAPKAWACLVSLVMSKAKSKRLLGSQEVFRTHGRSCICFVQGSKAPEEQIAAVKLSFWPQGEPSLGGKTNPLSPMMTARAPRHSSAAAEKGVLPHTRSPWALG